MFPLLGKSAFREISERGHTLVRKPQDCIDTWHQHHLVKLANVRWSEAEKKKSGMWLRGSWYLIRQVKLLGGLLQLEVWAKIKIRKKS
jgi:hypothetical protein